MPVPIAVTNPGGVGLKAHTLATLETQGPFARLAANMEPSVNITASTSSAADVASDHTVATAQSKSEDSVVVNSLEFSYPGLGTKDPWQFMPHHSSVKLVAHSDSVPMRSDGRPVPGLPPLIQDMSFSLKPGSRCLLLGGNGAGKVSGPC